MQSEDRGETRTLMDWAMEICPDSPRKRVKEWIKSGRFYLDGQVVTKGNMQLTDPRGALTFGKPDSATASWVHRRRIHPKLTVLYLDQDLAIVDKGAGLLSVPYEGNNEKSALDLLAEYLNDARGEATRRRLFGGPASVRPLPVHRLDKFTSGLLCIAMNPAARSSLIDQLHRHQLLREYIAIVDGTCHEESGTWRHFLKLEGGRFEQKLHLKSVEGSVQAVTHFILEKVFPQNRVSRLRIRLETGLKHQIRIQAAEAGLPLIGDRLYHKGTVTAMERKGATLPYGFRRQALHACLIGLKHPSSGKVLRFESKIPMDMARLEQRLS